MDDDTTTDQIPTAMFFAVAARRLCAAARQAGMQPPVFASPAAGGGDRSIRRNLDGTATVRIRLKGRTCTDVVEDMADGIIAANRVAAQDAEPLRRQLLDAV